MYKISEFAKLGGVSVKTLRYYDELGLLKPAEVDGQSGYRYYSAEQLLTVRRINAFKELGLTLEQIGPLIGAEAAEALAAGTLAEKREELDLAMREAQRRLQEIDERLRRLGEADVRPEGAARLRAVRPQLAASLRRSVPREQLCLLLDELKQAILSSGGAAEGPLTVIWHACGGDGEDADIEVAIPVDERFPDRGDVAVKRLPGLALAASLVHRCSPYSGSCPAAAELAAWMAAEGCRPSATEPVREVYLTADKDIYGSFRQAELLIPVEIDE